MIQNDTTAGSDSLKLQLMLKTIPGIRKGNDSSVSKKAKQNPAGAASEGTSTKVLMGARAAPNP